MITAILILSLFIAQLLAILLLEYRRPERALAWLFLSFCCPPLGLAFYYFLGAAYWHNRRIRRRGAPLLREIRSHVAGKITPIKEASDSLNRPMAARGELLRLLTGLSGSAVTARNRSRVLGSAQEAYAAMLEAIEAAHETIHMEFYIFRADATGLKFRDALIRKARQGVRVRLLCDGLGSHGLGRKFLQPLRQAGAEVHLFLPPLLALLERRFNFRNHRKILVVDGKVGFTGGLNIGDEYLGIDPKIGPWRDTHLQLEGDSVYHLQYIFIKDWRLAAGDCMSHPRFFPAHDCKEQEEVLVVAGGPEGAIDASQEMFFTAISEAKERLWMTTPYFIPDPAISRALKNAVMKGADVRILIPAKPDNPLVYQASLAYLDNLQDAGVKFYRYTAGFMHAKVMIVDGLFAAVGSANLDMRSFYSNFELTALLFSPDTVKGLAAAFERDLGDSEWIDPQIFKQRGRKVKLIQSLCQLLSPLL
ncbi:cardiolipin synthase [Paenibacillus sp. NFR01]|uniref:cardiolipin synthase n=1 Tax=Paenibacillus sp. NFR01 TaxID=1566279 RepID=UPI0008B5F951|nr:cardiolipin synthase [Paenibacillus sp. NFR01]SET98747.1 cardiolipin synthase [Paenibacillus sp. NFR01]